MLLGFCPARFGVLFYIVVLGCRYTPYNTGPCSQWCPVPNYGCDIARHQSVAVLCMLYKIRCSPMCLLNDALPGPYVPVWVTRGALVALLCTDAPPRSTAGLLFPSQCFSGTTLLTPYSMVSDWRISRAGSMLFYWPKLLYHYYSVLLLFPFSSSCL